MLKRCQKCGHVAEIPSPIPPEADCPGCGAIYSKVDAAVAMQSAMLHQARSQRGDSSETWSPRLKGFAALFATSAVFAFGYWLGASNTRSELQQIAAAAAAADARLVQTSLLGAEPQKVEPSSAPDAAKDAPRDVPPHIEVRMIAELKSKRYVPGRIDDKIQIQVEFLERHGKSVRAFDGVLVFTDLLENEIMRAKVEINQRVQSLSAMTWDGEIDYNQFMAPHQRLRSEPIENLRLAFEPGKILYEDGERVDLAR